MELLVNFLIGVAGAGITTYFTRRTSNQADIETAKELSELKKDGENAATKKVIEEITAKIETVKNEISFEKQREHEFVKERLLRVNTFLLYVERTQLLSIRLFLYLKNKSNSKELKQLLEDIVQNITDLDHERRMCFVLLNNDDISTEIQYISNVVNDYLRSLMALTNDAIGKLEDYRTFIENDLGTDPLSAKREALNYIEEFSKLNDKYNIAKEEKWENSYSAIIKAIVVVENLYEKNFHVKLNFDPEKLNHDTI